MVLHLTQWQGSSIVQGLLKQLSDPTGGMLPLLSALHPQQDHFGFLYWLSLYPLY